MSPFALPPKHTIDPFTLCSAILPPDANPLPTAPGPLHRPPNSSPVSSLVCSHHSPCCCLDDVQRTHQPVLLLPKAFQCFPIPHGIRSNFLTISCWVLQKRAQLWALGLSLILSPPLSCVLARVASFSVLNSKLLSSPGPLPRRFCAHIFPWLFPSCHSGIEAMVTSWRQINIKHPSLLSQHHSLHQQCLLTTSKHS